MDESAKILEPEYSSANNIEPGRKDGVIDKNGTKKKARLSLDIKGIITMSVSLVSFLIVTNSGSLSENPLGFVVPLVIGAHFTYIVF